MILDENNRFLYGTTKTRVIESHSLFSLFRVIYIIVFGEFIVFIS